MPDYYCQYKKRLTSEEMQVNAKWIYSYLRSKGWSVNAICACLGNWESECTLNPNRPQHSGFPTDTTGGFGLAQWTPWFKKYGNWCKAQGIGIVANSNNPSGRIEPQIAYHDYECKYGLNGKKTWYNNRGYSYKWEDFKVSTDSVERLATAYYWQYERSDANNPGTRPSQARRWYNYLANQSWTPITPSVYQNQPFMMQSSVFGTLRLYILYLLIMRILGKK